ncbi:MAG: hypothetical protein H0V90_04055 [Blastocatellia bacterium]|nr:hypothetical protein [Blastocatellia bacterium]
MELFNKLGREIESLWRDKNYNEEIFPTLAADALKRADMPSKVTPWEVLEWTLGQSELPPQKDLSGNFGDPPITLFVAPRFYIDVYFWVDGTTQIHQHSFCGAFQVLLGSSIHSWYEFERRESINKFTEIGDMSLKLCELLQTGEVQEILAGRQYIHSLFHLDQPSATIVVRTGQSPLSLPQYSYLKPYLAIDPFFDQQTVTKKIQCLNTLIRLKHPETDRLITELLKTSDFQTTFAILSAVRGHLQSNQLDQMFNLGTPQERFDKFLEIARQRHGASSDIFPEIFAFREWQNEIVKRRSYVTSPDHRFFFALLLNVEGRERIFALIKQRFPKSEPIEMVLDWVFELGQTRVVGTNSPNALGIEEFDDLDMFVLERLLKEETDEQIRTSVNTEYSAEKSESVLAKLDGSLSKIRDAAIFRPLFAGPQAPSLQTSLAA